MLVCSEINFSSLRRVSNKLKTNVSPKQKDLMLKEESIYGRMRLKEPGWLKDTSGTGMISFRGTRQTKENTNLETKIQGNRL